MQNWNMGKRDKANQLAFSTPLELEGRCACCQPKTALQNNLLPGSFIRATATQDGVYVHSTHEPTSQHFHTQNNGKEKRLARAKEFGLSILPIGPLFRGNTLLLPITDALQGQAQGILSIDMQPDQAAWKCKSTPFALEQVWQKIQQRILQHSSMQTILVQPYLTQYRLAYTSHVQADPRVNLYSGAQKQLEEWSGDLGHHLLRGTTRWRSPRYASLVGAGIGE